MALNQWQNIVFSCETNFGQSYQTVINYPMRPGGGRIPPLLCFFANNSLPRPPHIEVISGLGNPYKLSRPSPLVLLSMQNGFKNLKFAVKRITDIESTVLSSSEGASAIPALSIGPFEHAVWFQNLKFAVKRITDIESTVLSSALMCARIPQTPDHFKRVNKYHTFQTPFYCGFESVAKHCILI